MGLKDIVKNNHYPIIFIGSGISKRYLKNFPTWQDLLEDYWKNLFTEDIYSYFRKITEENKDKTQETQDFIANIKAADRVETEFNNRFFNGKITLDNLSIKDAQQKRISPFKYDLSNKFSEYELRDDVDTAEFDLFKKVLQKSKMIITTNYDSFLEDTLFKYSKQRPNIYVGQKGLFDQQIGWSELYKIHGSVGSPESIVINSNDYENFDNNSILISAKILSSMIDTPIIFLGYSLSDRNIRNLLKNFSTQLPNEDIRKSANRIFVVQYTPNEHNLFEEIINDSELNLDYTAIRTNNYSELYKKLVTIDEGASPYEIRRYQELIKKLIISKGQEGALESVLVSPTELDDLSDQIDEDKPIVVAMGESKYFYVYPDLLSYIKDYFEETDKYLPAVALSFVAHDGNSLTRTPFARYLKMVDVNSLKLKNGELQKLNSKIENNGKLDDVISSVSKTYQKNCSSLSEISKIQNDNPSSSNNDKFIQILTYNIRNVDRHELRDYILNEGLKNFENAIINQTGLKSNLRKLFLAYDLLVNGDIKPIKKAVQNPKD